MIKAAFLVLLMFTLAFGDPGEDGITVYVSNDCTSEICEDATFPNIRSALSELPEVGGIIILESGTYTGADNKNLDIVTPVTIRTIDLENTEVTVDCEGDGYGFKATNQPVLFEGFTIANCAGESGAAIDIEDGVSTTVLNMIFLGNSASGNGGAISVLGGTLEVGGSEFVLNRGAYGGAVFLYEAVMNVGGSSFTDNEFEDGGVIGCTGGGSVQLDGATTINNQDEDEITAMVCNECSLSIDGDTKCGEPQPIPQEPESPEPTPVEPAPSPVSPAPRPRPPPVTPTPVTPTPFPFEPDFGTPSSASTVIVNGVLLLSAIILGMM